MKAYVESTLAPLPSNVGRARPLAAEHERQDARWRS